MEYRSMVNVIIHQCFPTNIHIIDMDLNEYDRNHMTNYVQKTGNHWDRRENTRDDTLHQISFIKPLVNQIMIAADQILKQDGYEFDSIEMTNMWGNNLKKGESHPPHTHSNNILSGVYYLKSGSPIQFFDPRPAVHVFKPRNSANMNNSSMIEFNSEPNVGLIFPSWLMHWVPPTPNERISISWNILVRGEYGEPNTLQNAYI